MQQYQTDYLYIFYAKVTSAFLLRPSWKLMSDHSMLWLELKLIDHHCLLWLMQPMLVQQLLLKLVSQVRHPNRLWVCHQPCL